MKKIAIIFAGGTGSRMGNNGKPKQFLKVDGKPILIHTLNHFEKHKEIDEIYIAMKEDYIYETEKLLEEFSFKKVVEVLPGGETGQDSIYLALKAAYKNNKNDGIVLLHDGVRPLISKKLITDNIRSVEKYGTGITTTSCIETVIISETGDTVSSIPLRRNAFTAQAPQSFKLKEILELHEVERMRKEPYEDVVDSCTLYHRHGKEVAIVEGERGNIKITTPEDYFLFKALLNYKESLEVFQ